MTDAERIEVAARALHREWSREARIRRARETTDEAATRRWFAMPETARAQFRREAAAVIAALHTSST